MRNCKNCKNNKTGFICIFRMYMGGTTCPSDDRIDDEVVIITGGSSGIGKEIALELARRGGRVILAVRDVEAGKRVARQIHDISGRTAEVKAIDLSSLNSVRNFVDQLGIRFKCLNKNINLSSNDI